MIRTSYIGGADSAALLGLTPYGNILQTWRKKTGKESDDLDNHHIRRGNIIEPVIEDYVRLHLDSSCNHPQIRQKYGTPESWGVWGEWDVTGREGREPQMTVLHPKYPFVGGHPDGIGKKIVWEFKAPAPRSFGFMERTGVHIYWICQVQHYLWIMRSMGHRAELGIIAIWDFDEWKPLIVKVKPDLKLWSQFEKIYPAFWWHVENDIEPRMAGYEEVFDFVDDAVFDSILSGYIRATAARYENESEQDHLKSLIITYLQGKKRLETENHYVSASPQKRYGTEFVRLTVRERGKAATDEVATSDE